MGKESGAVTHTKEGGGGGGGKKRRAGKPQAPAVGRPGWLLQE